MDVAVPQRLGQRDARVQIAFRAPFGDDLLQRGGGDAQGLSITLVACTGAGGAFGVGQVAQPVQFLHGILQSVIGPLLGRGGAGLKMMVAGARRAG